MRRSLRERWQESLGTHVVEDVSRVSADLPYELQSKMFDQLAALGLGGAGLTVTLIGSILRNSSVIVWLPVIGFGLAAMLAVTGNIKLIDGLFGGRPILGEEQNLHCRDRCSHWFRLGRAKHERLLRRESWEEGEGAEFAAFFMIVAR